MKKADREKAEAIAQLREWVKPGDTVYTILDHVSASGMSRAIRVVVPVAKPAASSIHLPAEWKTEVDFLHPNYAVGKALGLRHWKRNGREQDALVIGGCGMDMGFHLVYSLSSALYGDGYTCLGEGLCPSPEHGNNRRRQTCECGREHYNHVILEREGWRTVYGGTEDGTCQKFVQIPTADHYGPGVIHRDGYALRHRWL